MATQNVFGARFNGGYWLTGGNVGIGTTTPNGLLHIYKENIDQQYTGAVHYLDVGANTWQSFTAGLSKDLTKISIQSSTANAGSINLYLYEGEGTGGTLLQTVNGVTWSGYALWTEVNFSPAVALTAGNQYTFRLELASGLPAVFHNASGGYSGGRSSEGAADDFNFRTYLESNVIVDGGNVGIGTTTPEGALDIVSRAGALIVPRMTTADRDALTAVNGMIIYNTTDNEFNFYENGAWVAK